MAIFELYAYRELCVTVSPTEFMTLFKNQTTHHSLPSLKSNLVFQIEKQCIQKTVVLKIYGKRYSTKYIPARLLVYRTFSH